VDDLDEPVIELLKNTGVNTMYIGIESFDDNDLRFYQKGITSNKIEKVIDDLIKHGYSFEVDAKRKLRPGFIIFNPYSSVESLLVNIKNFKKYKIPPKRLKRKLLIYRHTDLYERFSKSGMIDEKGNYQFLNPGIELVYNYFNNGLKRTEKIREEIRFLERLSHEFGIELDSSLKDIRIAIDNEWYELFEQLVIALKNNNLNQDVLEDWYINLVNKVDLNKIKELVSVEKQSILDEINSKYVLHKDFIRLFKMI
jgi:hypothetical protein